MNNIEKIKPSGIFTNYIFKTIPLAFDESMSYYETLCGILSLLKTQEEVINNNADVIKELEDYVTNYFKNLDVQEEINNKLDEMAEDGTLAEIIAQYVQLQSVLAYDTINDMKEATNLVDGCFAITYGHNEINDNGGAKYKIREIKNTDVIDNINIIALDDENLVAELINENNIRYFDSVDEMLTANLTIGNYAKTYGFYTTGDGGDASYKIRVKQNEEIANNITTFELDNNYIAELIDNTNNVKKYGVKADDETDNYEILNYLLENEILNTLYFPNGTYIISDILNVNGCAIISGQNMKYTIIKAPNGFVTSSSNTNKRNIKNLTIDGVEINENTCIEGVFAFSKLENLNIIHYDIGIYVKAGTWINEFENIIITYCNVGFKHQQNSGTFNNNTFNNCYFQHINEYCLWFMGNNNIFNGCNFETSEVVFDGTGKNIEFNNCYIEGNKNIIDINVAHYDCMISIIQCWLYASSSSSDGWLINLPTYSHAGVDSITGSFIIEKSNIMTTSIKPFNFKYNENGNETYDGISLKDNYYYNKGLLYYIDLFNIENCPNYATSYNPTPFYSDLPIYKEGNVAIYRFCNGNMKASKGSNMGIKLMGYYDKSSTGVSTIEIIPSKKYGNLASTIKNIPVLISYTDNTIESSTMEVQAGGYYIKVNSSKTTNRIIFNCEYSYSLYNPN